MGTTANIDSVLNDSLENDVIYTLDVKQLLERYNISRAAFYNRVKVLSLTSYKIDNKTYFDKTQVDLLDNLDNWVSNHPNRKLEDFLLMNAIEIIDSDDLSVPTETLAPAPKKSYSQVSNLQLSIPLESVSLIESIVDKVLSRLIPTSTSSNVKSVGLIKAQLDTLEAACKHGWLLTSSQILDLVGVKPYGDRFTRGSFTFVKGKKIGSQNSYKVEKIDN